MLTINKLLPRGRGLAPALVKRAPAVELDWDVRQKSRFDATDSAGRALGIFLPRGTPVRGGDVMVAEDGSLVRVVAAPQRVLVVRHCTEHGTPFDLMRAAYHLGNRHVQLELQPDRLLLEPDHVLADMLRQMHLIVSEESLPFEPEGGAYAAAHAAHGHAQHDHEHEREHDHHHGHGHGDAHGRDHGLAHAAPKPQAAHVHGPGCSHDHGHDDRRATVPIHAPVHVHGPGCSHDHDHEQGHDHGGAHDGHGHAHKPPR